LAVESGSVSWFTAETLCALVTRHRADDSVAKAIGRIIRTDLIVVDDLGMLLIGEDAAEGSTGSSFSAYERRSVRFRRSVTMQLRQTSSSLRCAAPSCGHADHRDGSMPSPCSAVGRLRLCRTPRRGSGP
jgi:hypothetical protein